MSRKNKLLIVLLSVIFCFSAFSLTAFAVGEGEGGYSDVIPGDNQGGDENGGNGSVDIPPENGGGDLGNGGNVDNNGENNGENIGGNAGESNAGENNDENYGENYGENNGGIDDNNSGGYVDNNGGDNGSEYNYGYYEENNGSAEEGGYGQGYEYSGESSYLGGGQTYVEPENIAPSAALYNSSGSVSEKTLNNNDWNDISERLKNASSSADDGDDFSFIQNDSSLTDNGGWMLIVSIVCFALSAAGILYFIVLTVQNKKNSRLAVAAETGRASKSSAGHDYYGDGYRTSSAKRSKKSSKFDTAEVSLPKNSQGKRYKNNGRRYR